MEPAFNQFQSFELSEEEKLIGQRLHPIQCAVLQNLRADVAQNILNLEYDPNDKEQFGLNRAMLQGQLQIIGVILDTSAAVEKAVAEQSFKSN